MKHCTVLPYHLILLLSGVLSSQSALAGPERELEIIWETQRCVRDMMPRVLYVRDEGSAIPALGKIFSVSRENIADIVAVMPTEISGAIEISGRSVWTDRQQFEELLAKDFHSVLFPLYEALGDELVKSFNMYSCGELSSVRTTAMVILLNWLSWTHGPNPGKSKMLKSARNIGRRAPANTSYFILIAASAEILGFGIETGAILNSFANAYGDTIEPSEHE